MRILLPFLFLIQTLLGTAQVLGGNEDVFSLTQPQLQASEFLLIGEQSLFLPGPKLPKLLFGFRAGVATANLATEEIDFQNAGRQFKVAVNDTEFGYHLGLFAHIRLNNWVIQPEVLFRSARTDYLLSEFVSGEFIRSVRTEKYAYLDAPLLLAYKLGPLRLQGGPVGRFYLDSSSEFLGIAEFKENYKDFELGYQAGIGFDLWRFIIDLKYDGDLDRVGDHITFAGEPLGFDERAGRFMFSIGYSLIRP